MERCRGFSLAAIFRSLEANVQCASVVGSGMAAGVLAGTMATAEGQQKAKKQIRARRETNASRQARIQRTIDATYSHRYEVFGGGGYLRWRSGEYTKRNNEVSWAAGGSYYLNPKLAIIGTAQGSFGNAHALINNPYGVYNPQINEYFFMVERNYRFYRKEKVALSAQGTGRHRLGHLLGRSQGLVGFDDRAVAGRVQACVLGRSECGLQLLSEPGVPGDTDVYRVDVQQCERRQRVPE